MAMSYYSNWEMNSDVAIADPELQALVNDLFSPDNLNSLETQPFSPEQEFEAEPFHYPKRQKGCDFDEIYSSLFNGLAPNYPFPAMLQDYSPPEIVAPPPFLDFAAAGCYAYSSGSCESATREAPPVAAVSLSAQSAAARQRRRRITEKTQELGKLVPGGQKMNTAEMLQSAYKYIKFLQAQFQLLEASRDKEEVAFEGEEVLQNLLESPLIQEKLYSTENCLVPHEFVEELRRDDRIIESNPNVLQCLERDY